MSEPMNENMTPEREAGRAAKKLRRGRRRWRRFLAVYTFLFLLAGAAAAGAEGENPYRADSYDFVLRFHLNAEAFSRMKDGVRIINESRAEVVNDEDMTAALKSGKVAAIFVNASTRRTTNLTFTATGTGDLTYYVSGVKAGTWTVKVGSTTKTATATSDGGLLVFTAPAGTVTLTPQ